MKIVLHTDNHDNESLIIPPFHDYWSLSLHHGKQIQDYCHANANKQLRHYEHWRRKQSFSCSFHWYMSHFPNAFRPIDITGHEALFAKYPEWTLTPNIWARRHQAFIEQHSNDWMMLIGANVLLDDSFRVDEILADPQFDFYSFQQPPSKYKKEEERLELTGIWLLSPKAQKLFASLDRSCFNENYRNDWFLAKVAEDYGLAILRDTRKFETVNNTYEFVAKELPEADYAPQFTDKIANPYLRWEYADFDAWRKSHEWRFASTMRWCPHEYVVASKQTGLILMDLWYPVDFMYRNGEVEFWKHKVNLSYNADGHKYWALCYTNIINRTSDELEQRIFTKDAEKKRKKENST
jgi:hypothetical protein